MKSRKQIESLYHHGMEMTRHSIRHTEQREVFSERKYVEWSRGIRFAHSAGMALKIFTL